MRGQRDQSVVAITADVVECDFNGKTSRQRDSPLNLDDTTFWATRARRDRCHDVERAERVT